MDLLVSAGMFGDSFAIADLFSTLDRSFSELSESTCHLGLCKVRSITPALFYFRGTHNEHGNRGENDDTGRI